MKKTILFLGLTLGVGFFTNSCSRNNDTEETLNPWENENYIKQKLIGKWKYWGHFSGYWVDSGETSIYYFTFNDDGTFHYQDMNAYAPKEYKGTYSITPATKTDNAVLYLSYYYKNDYHSRRIYLLDLTEDMVTVFESTWKQRYQKQ